MWSELLLLNTTWVAVWMLHELTVCLGSSYWLNISFCLDKPEWQRRKETPPLIIPPFLPLFIPPSLPVYPFSLSFPLFIQFFHPIFPSAHPSIIHRSSRFFVPLSIIPHYIPSSSLFRPASLSLIRFLLLFILPLLLSFSLHFLFAQLS